MIRRANAREGGLRAMQREAVALLLDAFDAGGPAAPYVAASLHWHVLQAQQPSIVIHSDAMIMRRCTVSSSTVPHWMHTASPRAASARACNCCDKST